MIGRSLLAPLRRTAGKAVPLGTFSTAPAPKEFPEISFEATAPAVAPVINPTVVPVTPPLNNSFWMPFTDNTSFKQNPRKMFDRAEGCYYYMEDGTPILDGMSGIWCSNAGHTHPKIVNAIVEQAKKLDFAPSFYTGHKAPNDFADRILDLLPGRNFGQVFFTMCGSTSVDTALKMALQYHRARGESSRVKFIGRDRSYHGVGFGGISVGGINPNRRHFSGNMLPHVDHLSHTHSLPDMAFSKGQPTWGAHLADELEKLVALHDPSTIAAVIVEPVAGSTGVLPPPVGYLNRLREICDKHGILLIFDEVITGFGRVGEYFATVKFDVNPDFITCAKGLTNAAVPCGAVISQSHIFDTITRAAHDQPGLQIEFNHGFTYSGHPLAMAAGMASLDVLQEDGLLDNVNSLAPYFEARLHELRGLPHVTDVRNIGFMGAVEVEMMPPGAPKQRSMDVFDRCFEKGVLLRGAGNNIVLSPTFISEKEHLDIMIDTLRESLLESAQYFPQEF